MNIPEEYPTRIRALTLNCWGLKYISTLRRERLAEIGAQLANYDPPLDLIGLQECWTQADYSKIRHELQHMLPYGKYYHSGAFGGGLAIFSRWPLEESYMFRYPLNGRPTAITHGDWFVGKGVACARIRIGPKTRDVLEVFNTHLHAPYDREPNDSYICHRTAQAWEIAKLLRGAVERGHLVLGLGDFNMLPLSLAHRIIETHGKVRDVWRILHPNSSLGPSNSKEEKLRGLSVPTAEYNLQENGATSDNVLNTWRWSKKDQKQLRKGQSLPEINGTTPDPRGKRLDYMFIGNSITKSQIEKPWNVGHAQVGMTARHPKLNCSLSDHFSIETSLVCHETLTENDNRWQPAPGDSAASKGTKRSTGAYPSQYLSIKDYDTILAMISKYTLREEKRRHIRLSSLILGILVAIGCHIAIWWSPSNYVSFILILLSTFVLSTGVINGIIGGLFEASELRALREFEWEIKNAKEMATATTNSHPAGVDKNG